MPLEEIETVTKRLERTAGDTYGIVATIKVDGVAIDITSDTLSFEYDGDISGSLAGDVSNGSAGEVTFTPTSDMVSGLYTFAIKRNSAGVIATHLRGDLVMLPSV